MSECRFEERAKNALTHLGLGQWRVSWLPDPLKPIRGKALSKIQVIYIYDEDEEAAWSTLIHEIVEIKLRSTLRPYRILVNKLIEGYQEITDGDKDRFIESLSEVFEFARASAT